MKKGINGTGKFLVLLIGTIGGLLLAITILDFYDGIAGISDALIVLWTTYITYSLFELPKMYFKHREYKIKEKKDK